MCSEGVHSIVFRACAKCVLKVCTVLCFGPAQNCCEKETVLVASSCLSVRWYKRDPIERTVIKLRVRDFLLRTVDTLGLV